MENIKEIYKKANKLDKSQLVEWLIEVYEDNDRLSEIILKYEEYSNAYIKDEKTAVYNPKTLQQEVYCYKHIIANINDKRIEYKRY